MPRASPKCRSENICMRSGGWIYPWTYPRSYPRTYPRICPRLYRWIYPWTYPRVYPWIRRDSSCFRCGPGEATRLGAGAAAEAGRRIGNCAPTSCGGCSARLPGVCRSSPRWGKSQDGTSSRIRQVVGLSPLPPYDMLLIESPRILVTSVVSNRRHMLHKNYQNSLQLLVPVHIYVILSMSG